MRSVRRGAVQMQAREDQERRERESADGGRREERRLWERNEQEGCSRSGIGYGGNWG